MKRLMIASVAALGVCAANPVFAQTTTSGSMQHAQAAGTQTQMTTPTAAKADLTGQIIYDSKGDKIGAVTAMNVDSKGRRVAVVSVERRMGMGGQDVLMPVDTLTPRAGGGYTTSLTASKIKHLPKAGKH